MQKMHILNKDRFFELNKNSVVAKFATVVADGRTGDANAKIRQGEREGLGKFFRQRQLVRLWRRSALGGKY